MNKKSINSVNKEFKNIHKFYPLSIRPDRLKNYLYVIIRAVLIIGICYIIIFPLLVKLSSALMSLTDFYDQTVMWIPRSPNLNNFTRAFRDMEYPVAFVNSLLLASLVGFLQMISCTVVGYGLARFKFRGQSIIFTAVILTLVIPPQMIMIPLYLNFRYFTFFGLLPGEGINLLNSFWPFVFTSLTAVGMKNGLFIYIMRQFFRNMPRQLEEAAYIDGASPITAFLRVMLPGAIPALVIVFLFSFVWQWNDYFYTNIFMSGNTVLPMTLASLRRIIEGPQTTAVINAGSLMFVAPLLLLYALLQRYFVESINRTGLVG